MVTSSRARVCLFCAAVVLPTLSHAVTPDRINGPLSAGPKIALRGNVHGLAKPENDLGLADGNRPMQGITLAFHPSAAQQKDLDNFLAELGDPSSPNYHKYLTPKQFGQRFGMSSNDLNKVISWLQSEGFTNIKVANSRNEIAFDGTVAQVELAFDVEMHHYLVGDVVHLANASEPSVPSAIAASVVNISGLHTFAPRPTAKVQSRLTSYITGNHFLAPADFATIYDLDSLYNATPAIDGTGQKIAVIGQSSVNQSDINNFRSAAQLPASTITTIAVPSGSTPTRCAGDESESDLDLEWSGGIAKNASIIFVTASLATGDTCTGSRSNSVWNALDQAIQGNVAPFISTSYGFCEQGLGQSFANQVQQWAVQGQTQGQTIVAATGDAGAADCDTGASATQGLAVDLPAAIPEVTSAGGTEFTGDSAGTVSGTPPATTAAATQYWGASLSGNDAIATALGHIPEEAWNDTTASIAAGGNLSASGGGASIFFQKPTWQAGTGVPSNTMRNMPDIAVSASPNHDGYLVCSEDDGKGGIISGACTPTPGFRTGAGGNFTAVGGTSVAAPTFAAILALVNQSLGNTPPAGLAPVNPRLYELASSYSADFNDVTSGDNKVPCTSGSTDCPSGTTSIGFSAGTGYDQVTGLGSVNAAKLAQDFAAQGFLLTPNAGSFQVAQGSTVTVNVTVTPLNGFSGAITYTCTDAVSESTCTGPTTALNSSQAASFTVTTKAPIARLERPFNRGSRIFYATLLPGLLGIVFVANSRNRLLRGVRFLGLLLMLSFSTIWITSCGGSSSSTKDPGTPTGTYSITVTGTSGSLTSSTSFSLVVVQ